ncbi:MAG: transporter substrate-binding domain-containing protein [Pseudomonadota bacterium]|nr:transporter substrate-binding domain-containing protein [Pseudomonadota bacterium]
MLALLFWLAIPAGAATVRMAFGDNLPPYILVDSSAGIEVDIVREALAYRGHVLEPVFTPMGRIPLMFIGAKVDAIMMDVGQDMTAAGGFYGEPPVLYDNVLFTLAARHLQLRRPGDLDKLFVMSFVGAAIRYPDWLGRHQRTPLYVERNNQAVQPRLLALGRYDAVVSDRTIFAYYARQQERADPRFRMPAVDEHQLPPADPRAYRPVFNDATVRDDFNAGLAWLRKSGRYAAIYQRYLSGE